MISSAPIITNAGKSLFLRSLGGETITFTGFKVGNGELPAGADGSDMLDIINPVLTFPIRKIERLENNMRVEGDFDNSDIQSDFQWTELGLFCVGEANCKFSGDGEATEFVITDKPAKLHRVLVGDTIQTILSYDSSTGEFTLESAPAAGTDNITAYYTDDDEVLYAYANDGENAGTLKANMTAIVAELKVAFVIALGDSENITAILSQSLLYASKTDFDNHVAADNPHHINAQKVGLGNVPNVDTNDQTPTYESRQTLAELTSGEKLSSAFSKIAKVVKDFIAHVTLKNNPHSVTAAQVGAATTSHTHNASNINAGILPVARGGTGQNTLAALANELSPYIGTGSAVFGTYNGDGTTKRTISLGFTPSAVIVVDGRGRMTDQDIVYGGVCIGTKGVRSVSCTASSHESTWANGHTALLITSDGFFCSYYSSNIKTNTSGETYRYIAFR